MIIGIDFGKTTGLAFAIDGSSMALPWCITKDIKETAQKILMKKATQLIVGWPLLLSGEEGTQCAQVMEMLHGLIAITGPIAYALQDERFSSKFFKHMQEEHAHSAAWILQSWLDKHPKGI